MNNLTSEESGNEFSDILKCGVPAETPANNGTARPMSESEAQFEKPRTLNDLGKLLPEDEDPQVLFQRNWMGRGGGLVVVAPTGVGKSSFLMQCFINWTRGKRFVGMPIRPMKCAIVQSEDSCRDMLEQREGMRRGLSEDGWTEEEINAAFSNVQIWDPKGKVGDNFISWLKGCQSKYKVDCIGINPLQGFVGADIADITATSHFLREGLDPILKDENAPCMAMVMAHTTKLSSSRDYSINIDENSEYIGAGSHDLSDWTRAKLVLLRQKNHPGYFDLKAAKRDRLQWKDANNTPTSKITLAHSDGFIYWRVLDPQADNRELQHPKSMTTKDRTTAKHNNDKGTRDNALALVSYVKDEIKADRSIDHAKLVQKAKSLWVKETARKAVTEFGEICESNGIIPHPGDPYTLK